MDILKSLFMKFVFRMSFATLCAILLVTSCTKEDVNVEEISNFVNGSLDGVERSCKTGKHGCFEFVWPVTLEFADGTVSEFADQESLRTGITEWKEANPESETRPVLVFPLEILDEEGTLFSVASQEELREVVRSCKDSFGRRGHARQSCISINYPISIIYPDQSTESFEDRMSMKTALRAWKEDNPGADTRPTLVFPIEVTIKESEEVVGVNSKEELQALKKDCRNN